MRLYSDPDCCLLAHHNGRQIRKSLEKGEPAIESELPRGLSMAARKVALLVGCDLIRSLLPARHSQPHLGSNH